MPVDFYDSGDNFAPEDDVPDVQIAVQQDHIGPLAAVQAAAAAVDTDGPGGVHRRRADGVCQGDAEGHGSLQAAHQVGDRPGQSAVGQGGVLAPLGDGLSAQGILPVLHPGGPHGVADEDDSVGAEELEGGADHGGVDVHAVADQLHPAVRGVERGAEISPVTKSGEAVSSDNGFDRTSFLSGDQIKVTRTKKASGTAASQSASYRYD